MFFHLINAIPIYLFIFLSFYSTELNLPRFAEPIPNITVTIGKDALLACVVDNLKSYRVSYHVKLFRILLLEECFLNIVFRLFRNIVDSKRQKLVFVGSINRIAGVEIRSNPG